MVGSSLRIPRSAPGSPTLLNPVRKGKLAGDECRPPRRATLLGVIRHELPALSGESIDVGSPISHHVLMVCAEVPDPDIVAHDDQDIRLPGGVRAAGSWAKRGCGQQYPPLSSRCGKSRLRGILGDQTRARHDGCSQPAKNGSHGENAERTRTHSTDHMRLSWIGVNGISQPVEPKRTQGSRSGISPDIFHDKMIAFSGGRHKSVNRKILRHG